MSRRISIIQGHPDADAPHLCHALADAYRAGAEAAGHEVRRIDVAALSFPLIRSKHAFERDQPPDAIREAQSVIRTSDHLVIVYPLWLGGMPALLKGFFEQVLRDDFSTEQDARGAARPGLKGRSARVVVTMGMPVPAYRWWFGAHGLKSLERSILRFVGIAPVRESLFGLVETAGEAKRQRWLEELHRLGGKGV